MGSKLAAGATVSLNPLLAAGWAGLLANALNCIPVGAHQAFTLHCNPSLCNADDMLSLDMQ